MALMLLLSLLLMLHLSKLPGIPDASVKRAVQLAGSDPATETSEGKLVSLQSSSVEARGLEFSANIPSSSSLSGSFSSSSEAVDKDNEDSGSLLRPVAASAASWSAPDAQMGQMSKKTARNWNKKLGKLTVLTYACNSLTNFECEFHPFAGNGNAGNGFFLNRKITM